MIKRVMYVALAIALVLTQSGVASAFTRDGIYGLDNTDPEYLGSAFTATTTVTGTPIATLSVQVKDVDTGNVDANQQLNWGGGINWSDIAAGTVDWVVSDDYLQVTYSANQIGWGVQLYTDNTDTNASPKYPGDPTVDLSQQPAGLIGETNNDLTCSLVSLVTNTRILPASIQVPNLVESGTPGTPDYAKYFDTGFNEDPATATVEKVWFWLKDAGATKWDDKNSNGLVDLTGSYGDASYEIVSDFSATGDDYATIVNTRGSSSGWVHETGGNMQRDSLANSPVCVYMAADFSTARELQSYTTNTITVEIYHQ